MTASRKRRPYPWGSMVWFFIVAALLFVAAAAWPYTPPPDLGGKAPIATAPAAP